MGNQGSKQGLSYDLMIEDALRGVMGRVLAQVAERGLPGNHHFYITFRTGHPGVQIPAPLRRRHGGEMTIVLQHQFSGLEAGPDAFAVTLSFSEVPHRLTIPYDAVVSFADPSVEFALSFEVDSKPPQAEIVPRGKKKSPRRGRIPVSGDPDKVVALDTFRKR